MKSEESNKSGYTGENGATSETVTSASGTVEEGVEAKENVKRKGSWMKNIGSGMRTLRLRKHTSDKKNDKVLNRLASSSVLDAEDERSGGDHGSPSNNPPHHPIPPQHPLPPIPIDSATVASSSSVPPSPSPIKTLPKVKNKKSTDSSPSLKKHTSRLSLREHMSKSKGKKGDTAELNGSAPLESFSQKSSSGGSGTNNGPSDTSDKADPARFIGEGLCFKAKLIGILEVTGPRGDRICQEALSELKMAVKAAGEHKQKVTIHVALDGLRVRDEKTADCLYHHQVHKISFIAQDLTDTRAFGYIFGSPDTGHRFFGIKTEKSASQVVMSMRDLFQVVFDLKKKEIERAKQQLEMQQKFLATRAAETTIRTSHKSGIAETYIDGACALGGSPSTNTTSVPAEADLLNLEVELTSLQEGLDNIHSTLIDTATSHTPFNRGSTASISSDPMNPSAASFSKYNSSLNSTVSGQQGGGGITTQIIPPYTNANTSGQENDPFGDSFDPFDSTAKLLGQGIASPSFPTDPFTHIDPFVGTKFSSGLESNELLTSDPFETPVGGCSFTFPDSGGRIINRQISITSNSSDISSGKASIGPDLSTPRPVPSASPNLCKSDLSNSSFAAAVTSWTASFEDNFGAANGTSKHNIGSGDLFRDLDPLGSGLVKPFVDRKDFFQDLKNPPRKLLNELSTPPTGGTTVQPKESTLKPLHSESQSPLPNSFSTNFNPVTSNLEIETIVKVPPPSKVDIHLRTSSIRAPLSGDTPPSYSPPPPPQQANIVSSSSTSPSVYFVNAPPKHATPPTAKKSPQLLRNMTIASATSSHVVTITGQSASPKTLPRAGLRLGKQNTVDILSSGEEIPNLTPPPRPPHTTMSHNSTLNRTSILPSALPRPHSGGEGRRQLITSSSLQVTTGGTVPPEPPPRPMTAPSEPFLSPPPLPPKKQTLGPVISNPSLPNFNSNVKTRLVMPGDSWNSNDLPLPLPSRKGYQVSNSNTQPRYNYPLENTSAQVVLPPPPGRFSTLEEIFVPVSVSISNVSQTQQSYPGLTMEAALNQVASLSLTQLAGKLETPVEKLSTCTIQELAIKLTMLNFREEKKSTEAARTLPMSFESNFTENFGKDKDFSTVSAPATTIPKEPPRPSVSSGNIQKQCNFDKYAVFRELAESEAASGFTLCDPQDALVLEDEEEVDEQRSRTLTSHESSSEKTLQAEFDVPGNGVSTMDDITDVNLSEGEEDDDKSCLFDEVVDLNLKAEWATFESNFDDQFVPLAATFSKSEESPWDSDVDNNKSNVGPTDIVTKQLSQLPPSQKVRSPKKDELFDQSSPFDFQLFEKPLVSVDPVGRRNSRGNELRPHDSLQSRQFQRQSSGSSKHSDKSVGNLPISSRNITTSDYSDSGKEREKPHVTRQGDWNGDERRRTESRNSGTRKYSRGDSDEGSGRRKTKHRYYYEDDDDEGTDSRSPVERKLTHHRRPDDDECYSNTSSRQSHSQTHRSARHLHSNKYYSQSLQRRDREGRYGFSSARRPSENEKYSNHESDFDDSYEDDRRRGRGNSGYSRSEKEHRVNSRPASSGGSVSGSISRNRKQRYRDTSREYYYHHHRDNREPRHSRDQRGCGLPYHHSRNRAEDDDFMNDGRECSDYSEGEEGSKARRLRGRRRGERDRDSRPYYHTNSPSWDSESPTSGKETPWDKGNGNEMVRGTRIRRSDMDRPRERERDLRERERPSSSSYHGDRLDGIKRKGSRYQSDLSLNANKSTAKLNVSEFRYEEDFIGPSHAQPPSSSQDRKYHHPSQSSQVGGTSSRGQTPGPKHPLSESTSNKSEPPANFVSNKLSAEPHYHQQPPPESPFEDNFVSENNIFFPADFTGKGSENNKEEGLKISTASVMGSTNINSNQNGPESVSSRTSESVEKSDENEENSSPDGIIGKERNYLGEDHPSQPETQQMIQVVRKPIINDTIHEVPDGEMKKSDSFNIFEREKDPFADDDFFT